MNLGKIYNPIFNDDIKSFQNGVDKIYNKCIASGSTPTNKTPDAICNSIQSIYTDRYNTGYNKGKTDGASSVTIKAQSQKANAQVVLYNSSWQEKARFTFCVTIDSSGALSISTSGGIVNENYIYPDGLPLFTAWSVSNK